MKKFYVILAAIAGMTFTSCTSNEYLGDLDPTGGQVDDGSIKFGLSLPATTRADIQGKAAADLLGNNFYVTGTKGTEAATYPTTELVFDNYLVHFGVNTAGTTASNTANWEYVGVKPGTGDYANYAFLTSMSPAREVDNQTIKFWDYSKTQYDFMAFSTGTWKAVNSTTPDKDNEEIGVTYMKYGSQLDVNGGASPVAYTFYLPSETALQNAYISDIVEVPQANYGKEVQLQFKSLGSKVRVALYETVPGYSVKDVQFYTVEGAVTPTDLDTDLSGSTSAILISPTGAGIPTKGTISVLFPHVGDNNATEQDYNKATATVSPGADPAMTKTFGALTAQLVAKENKEVVGGNVYLGRTLPTATFAGNANAQYYQTVFPVSTSAPLILRVNYTLVPTDGASETIVVKGAKAVVPSTYTVWKPNYAYTYIFKISDNTNGWTGAANKPAGLFPITFDAVVAEATDANAEQRTVTTVATPSITTYQQYHKTTADEYSKTVKDLKGNNADRNVYVQVMDNSISPAKLIGTSPSTKPLLNTSTEEGTPASRLFDVTTTGAAISEATVMDALENRTTDLDADNVIGRNKITLTKVDEIDNTVTSIVNGVDDNPITKIEGVAITAGQVAEIDISDLTADHTYAYVYDYTGASTEKVLTTVWQPVATVTGTTVVTGLQSITVAALTTWDNTAANHTSESEAAAKDYLYFSVTTNGGATKTFSFVSVDDKIGQTLPDGLLKLPKGQLTNITTPDTKAADDTFYFTTYVRNDGKYAVKVIKIVA